MENRGFTLIELVAIIAILATIFLISFPNFKNSANKNNEVKYESMIDDLCLAGKSYIYANMEDFEGLTIIGNRLELEIKKLISYGNVDKNLVNVKTKKSVQNDVLIFTVEEDTSLSCEYIEK